MTISYRRRLPLPRGCVLLLAASLVSATSWFSSPHHRRSHDTTSCELHQSGAILLNDECSSSHIATKILHNNENDHLQRNKFLSLLLSTRGGAASKNDSNFYNTNDKDDEELLDSIFFADDKLTNSVREKASIRNDKSRGLPSYSNNQADRISRSKTQQQQQQQQPPHNIIQLEQRKEMLSKLAMTMQDSHTSTVQALIKGNAAHIPPALFGQTILQEKAACHEKFRDVTSDSYNSNIDIKEELKSIKNGQNSDEMDKSGGPTFQHIEDPNLLSYWGLTPDARLYGGAQYHRVLRYYHHLFLTVPLPPITDDEVALLTNGITDVHDASDLMRAVALLVQHKLELVMEDVLADMTRRLLYVMERQWELVEYSMTLHRPMGGAGSGLGKSGDKLRRETKLYSRYGPEFTAAEKDLMSVLSISFHKFAQERAADAHEKSVEDVRSLLRYVTWDMGRARTRDNTRNSEYQSSEGGYVTQIEIVRDDSPFFDELPNEQPDEVAESRSDRSKSSRKRKQKKKSAYSDSTKRRMIARGGAAIGSGRKRSQLRSDDENESITSIRAADQDSAKVDEEVEHEDDFTSTSIVLTSQTSPMFSGDDEVLSLLLDTLSTTLVPKSERQAGQTQVAIENLTSYITDRMRLDLSRMIRSKFNTFFLLPFYEDLGIYLRRELDSYLANVVG